MSNPEKPCGFWVLVEMEEIKKETEWGFKLQTIEEEKREQGGACIGVIREFGPVAYKGFAGCSGPDDWGVKVGDRFRTHRYAGFEIMEHVNFRLIQDSDLMSIIPEGDV